MREYLKDKLRQLLDKSGNERNIDFVVDELLEELDSFILHSYRRRFYYIKRLDDIENKLDILMERNSEIRCRFFEENSDSLYKYINGLGLEDRKKAILYLSEILEGAELLTICDPYFIKSNNVTSPEEAVREFITILPKTLKKLELYVKPRVRQKLFAENLNKALKEKNIKLIVRKTDDIHDRVWIKDDDEAFVVGTSFNGLGNKCTFILDLPSEDREKFICSLKELSRKLSKSKSV